MLKFTTLTSRIAALPLNDIDTDQIIPARFLKATGKTGLGAHLFAGWRYTGDSAPNADFILNQPESTGAQILLAGHNFGCGSSREHAPWALLDAGIQAIVSSEIADIFRSNAMKNGLLACVIASDAHAQLLAEPGKQVSIDVKTATVSFDGASHAFPLDPFTQHCLLNGVDQLGFILTHANEIAAFEASTQQKAAA